MAAQLQATHMYSILELVSGLVQPLLSRKPKLPQNPPTKLLITFHGQWRTGKPGMLQSMWSHRVGHDLATEQGQNCITGPLEDEGRPDIRYLAILSSIVGTEKERRWKVGAMLSQQQGLPPSPFSKASSTHSPEKQVAWGSTQGPGPSASVPHAHPLPQCGLRWLSEQEHWLSECSWSGVNLSVI